jgi:hypothetical protein
MTSVLERSSTVPGADPGQRSVGVPAVPRRRRPWAVVVSMMVVVASVAVFVELYSSADHQTSAIIVTRTIQQGQPITGGDLGETRVDVSGGVTPIPVSDAAQLAGKRAAVTIPAGSLLTPADVTGAQPIPAGDAVVGLALKPDQLPSQGVQPGQPVMVVQTAGPGTALTGTTSGGSSDPGSSTGVLVPAATVTDAQAPPGGSASSVAELVSVEVSATLAPAVSVAAAADQVSLVLLAPTGCPGGAPAPCAGGSTGTGGDR